MSQTLVYYSDTFLEHAEGSSEGVDRVRISRQRLVQAQQMGLIQFDWTEPLPASDEFLQRLHSKEYIEAFKKACKRGAFSFTAIVDS